MKQANPWTPTVLSEFEYGECISAIRAVLRTDKPIVEVCTRQAVLSDLESDLRGCLHWYPGADVQYWTREASTGRYRYGFYRHAWALHALDWLARTELEPGDRAWISGLVFGYSPASIQGFINEKAPLVAHCGWDYQGLYARYRQTEAALLECRKQVRSA